MFSPFENAKIAKIPEDCDIVFVADLFSEDYKGGAEMTTEALIEASPLNVFKLKSKDVDMSLLSSGHSKHWVFTNFSQMDMNLIPTIAANMSYSIVEYDYKFCRYRSIEKHKLAENAECNCHNEPYGKMISAFFYGAKSLWWMSEQQLDRYLKRFPFLEEKDNTVLSSVFDDNFFLSIKQLRHSAQGQQRKGYIVLGSQSWIKGASAAEDYCKKNNLDYEVVWNVPYNELLQKLSLAEGFVYLPEGGDTCPRMVIEAKLLGCKLILNDDVQHAEEEWFATDHLLDIESYLYAARERFWNGIKYSMDYKSTISGYTTTLNCIRHNYPWKAAINSMLGFSDEVVVVDGGSNDGTWEQLEKWASDEPRLKIKKIDRDWEDSRFAVFDGAQKAEARKLCTSEFCWQQDADEVVHENDYGKVQDLVRNFPRNAELVSLPVIEYWGSTGKARIDINPWKWRLSVNRGHITHGIPVELRQNDKDGKLYAKPGTDGCDYVHAETFFRIPHASFYSQEIHDARLGALSGKENDLDAYEKWMSTVSDSLPTIHHYSWFDLPRKIRTYRDYWSKHWQSLYDIKQEDTGENNMFFQRPWSEVTDDDIINLGNRLQKEMGGWIFHNPVDFSKPTPSFKPSVGHPSYILDWIKENEK